MKIFKLILITALSFASGWYSFAAVQGFVKSEFIGFTFAITISYLIFRLSARLIDPHAINASCEKKIIRPATDDDVVTRIHISTFNGLGATIRGSYGKKGEMQRVYVFLSVLFIPVIPLACIVCSKGRRRLENNIVESEASRKIKIYGISKWSFLEVLDVYFKTAVVLCIISTLLSLIFCEPAISAG